jgi:hypothetical protein
MLNQQCVFFARPRKFGKLLTLTHKHTLSVRG